MKKFLSIFLVVSICFSSFSIIAFAQEDKNIYSFEYDGRSLYYYKDEQGNPYIIDDGVKSYIAVPEFIEKITDKSQLESLRKEFNSTSLQNNARATVLFSQTIYFNVLPNTGILSITEDNISLKCSNLNPIGAKRGFSYWINYSSDGKNWERAFFVNESLLIPLRHPMELFGYASYIKIQIFSYYDTVSSCLFTVKEVNDYGL